MFRGFILCALAGAAMVPAGAAFAQHGGGSPGGMGVPGGMGGVGNVGGMGPGGMGNMGGAQAEEIPMHGRPFSLRLTLPPLSGLFFKAT